MSDLLYWKTSKEGHLIVKAVEMELQKVKDEITDGFLLKSQNNEELAKVYAKKIGYLEGLNFIERLISDARHNSGDEDSI